MPIKNDKARNSAWIPLVMTLMLAIGFLTGLKSSKQNGGSLVSVQSNKSKASFKVDEVLGFISQRYVDSVDVDGLAEAAIRMIVDSLDPHSHYLSAESVEEYQAKMEGYYVGIGIEFRLLRDTLVITDVLGGSPAEAAGLHRGDQILLVGNDTISGVEKESRAIYDIMKGEDGSQVEVQYLNCDKTLSTAEITRARVQTKSIPTAIKIDDETVYVVIEQFNAKTSKEFLDVLEPFHEKGEAKNLVIDLRGNPGGYLQESVKILNQFFDEKGKLLVYTEGLSSNKKEYKTLGKPYLRIENLFILIDEESASASEIVAGAIQDLDRGTIIGRRSFGKGLVQEQYKLSHGGQLKLTIAKYYTPAGRLIQKQLSNRSDYDDEFYGRSSSGEWSFASSIPNPDTTKYYSTDGRELYGGRGIVPDVFIPIDSQLLAENAYEFFVLKEELGFDLYRHSQCKDENLTSIIESLDSPYWKEWLKNKTTFDNFGRLQSVTNDYADKFRSDLVNILFRYQGGEAAYYKQNLEEDPYLDAVHQLLATSTTKFQATNTVE